MSPSCKLVYFYFSSHLNFAEINQLSYFYPVFRKSFFIYNLHRIRLSSGAITDYLLKPSLIYESVTLEQAESALNIIILLLLSKFDNNFIDLVEEFEISSNECTFIKLLDSETLKKLSLDLRGNKSLHETLKEMLKQKKYYPECACKAYAILSALEQFDLSLSHLVSESKKYTGDIKTSISRCVERVFRQQKPDLEMATSILNYLADISEPWQPDALRLRASKILGIVSFHFYNSIKERKKAFAFAFSNLLLSLLNDDDYDVRNNATKVVLSLQKDKLNLGKSVFQFIYISYLKSLFTQTLLYLVLPKDYFYNTLLIFYVK